MPARFNRIIRACEARGVQVEKPPGGGSHWKLRGQDGSAYTITAHNGTKSEITDLYIRKLCRFFGFDRDAFVRDL